MRPFIPTALETHLMVDHGVSGQHIASVREQHPDNAVKASMISHALMHEMGWADHPYELYTDD